LMRTVALPSGETVSAVGQGTWYMGERRGDAAREADALRLGIDLGMTLIDTAEMYAGGGAEQVVAQAVSGIRDQIFIVSKVLPQNASRSGVPAACERSLQRLKTDRIDLYLLHWRGGHPLAETVAAFEALKAEGKIRQWGVSNLDTADMTELLGVASGSGCAADQVLYHPDSRGIEFDLLPWCTQHRIPLMGYSPLGHHVRKLLGSSALQAIARRHGATAAQVAIAWGLRSGNVISIPKAADAAHVRENAAASDIELTRQDLAEIDAVHRPPGRRVALDLL
jgi:diketogulonate reductase-like aldo/keto reductase